MNFNSLLIVWKTHWLQYSSEFSQHDDVFILYNLNSIAIPR